MKYLSNVSLLKDPSLDILEGLPHLSVVRKFYKYALDSDFLLLLTLADLLMPNNLSNIKFNKCA